MKQVVIPVGKRILIKRKASVTKTASGIIIPEVAQKKEFIALRQHQLVVSVCVNCLFRDM